MNKHPKCPYPGCPGHLIPMAFAHSALCSHCTDGVPIAAAPEIRTYDPGELKVTWRGPDGQKLDLSETHNPWAFLPEADLRCQPHITETTLLVYASMALEPERYVWARGRTVYFTPSAMASLLLDDSNNRIADWHGIADPGGYARYYGSHRLLDLQRICRERYIPTAGSWSDTVREVLREYFEGLP